MSVNLVRVAVYDHPMKANVARNCLEAEGIRAFLGNDQIAEMNWLWTNAIGGIELRVDESQLEKAQLVLERLEGGAEELGESPDEPPEDAFDDEEDEEDVSPPKAAQLDQAAADQKLDDTVNRAFRGMILGLVMIPLQIYVFWLLLRIFLSEATLTERGRTRFLITAVINIPMMLLVVPKVMMFGWLFMLDYLRY